MFSRGGSIISRWGRNHHPNPAGPGAFRKNKYVKKTELGHVGVGLWARDTLDQPIFCATNMFSSVSMMICVVNTNQSTDHH